MSDEEHQKFKGTVVISFCKSVSGRIGGLLHNVGILIVFCPPSQIKRWLRPVKDHLGLNVLEVY